MESLKYRTDPTAGTNTAARIGRPELRVWLLGNFPRHSLLRDHLASNEMDLYLNVDTAPC